jgi:hypothetical protein
MIWYKFLKADLKYSVLNLNVLGGNLLNTLYNTTLDSRKSKGKGMCKCFLDLVLMSWTEELNWR